MGKKCLLHTPKSPLPVDFTISWALSCSASCQRQERSACSPRLLSQRKASREEGLGAQPNIKQAQIHTSCVRLQTLKAHTLKHTCCVTCCVTCRVTCSTRPQTLVLDHTQQKSTRRTAKTAQPTALLQALLQALMLGDEGTWKIGCCSHIWVIVSRVSFHAFAPLSPTRTCGEMKACASRT